MEQWYYKQIAPRAHRSVEKLPGQSVAEILIFLVSRLYFLIIALIAPAIVRLDPGYLGSQVSRGEPSLVWVWANFDGRHFITIAEKGYSGTNFAFFPLYPLLINLLGRFGLPPIYAGIAISSLATIFSLFFLLKIVALDSYGGENKRRFFLETSFLLLFFPLGFILNSVYSDALFLLLTTAGFYYARSRHWFIAGIVAVFASLTRLTGIALIPALVLEWWLQNRKQKIDPSGLIAPFGAFLGFAAYSLYLQFHFGSWRLFQTSMQAWQLERIIFLPQVFYRYFNIFLTVSPRLLVYWVAALELVTFLLALALAVYVAKRLRTSYALFIAVVLLLRTFNGTLASTPRYLIHLFPIYLGLALLFSRHAWFRIIYYPAAFVLGILLTALFVQGRFIG